MADSAIAEAPAPSADAALAVATAAPMHASDDGDIPLGDFGSPDPNTNPEADIKPPKFLPPKRGTSPQAPPKPSGETAEPLKPAAKPEGKADEKAPEKPADKPEEFNPEKAAPKQLREAYAKIKARAATLEKELADHKAKPAAPADDPEKKVFQDKLTAAEKRNAELMEDLKFVDFERHPDYAEKYQKPFETAYQAGRTHVSKISVNLPDGTTRKGTPDDFDAIARLSQMDYDAAATKAEEMFGPVKAATVLHHLNRAQELNDARTAAAAEWKTKGNEREKARSVEREAFHKQVGEEVRTHWKQSLEDAQKKYQQWSAPIEGDEEGNALLEKGYKQAAEAFQSFDVMSPKLDKQQRADLVNKHAAVFNKSSWFDRLAHKHAGTLKELKATKDKLAEYEASTPKGGDGGRTAAPQDADGDQSIAAFLQKGARR